MKLTYTSGFFSALRAEIRALRPKRFMSTKFLDTGQPKIYLTLKVFYLALCRLFSFCRLKYNRWLPLHTSVFTNFTKKHWKITNAPTRVGGVLASLLKQKSPWVSPEAELKNNSHDSLTRISCGPILFIVLACEFFCNGFFSQRRKIA